MPTAPTNDWNDFRYLLAVADAGSVVAAARQLGVTHSTVLRRINAFEERMGVRLFERLATGYKPTPGGEEMLDIARAMADQIATLDRRIAGRDRRTSGTVRFTTTDSLLAGIVIGHLASFRKNYPDIHLDITTVPGSVDLGAREADVALRATTKPPDTLVGWRICDLAFAVYGAARSATPKKRDAVVPSAPGARAWIAPSGGIARIKAADYIARRTGDIEVALGIDSFRGIHDAIAADLGIGFLPCYFADASRQVVRVAPVVPELTIGLWLITHEDLRSVPRVRAVMDFFNAALAPDKALFAGERPRP